MSLADRMLKIDRRIIFLVIGLCTLLPLLYPVGLPIKISPEVRGVYDYIEALPEGSVFLLSLDFDPASKPELHPQSIALLRHAFRKNLRVIGMTLWVSGTGMADQLITEVAKEAGKEPGKDYVFLGWSPGGSAACSGARRSGARCSGGGSRGGSRFLRGFHFFGVSGRRHDGDERRVGAADDAAEQAGDDRPGERRQGHEQVQGLHRDHLVDPGEHRYRGAGPLPVDTLGAFPAPPYPPSALLLSLIP